MGFMDSFAEWFGFGAGAQAANDLIGAVEGGYRAKYFDPAVRRDMRDILVYGRLEKINYPFPRNNASKEKRPPFFIRHKVFSISLLVYVGIIMLLSRISRDEEFLYNAIMRVVALFVVFWIVYFFVLLAKKIKRGSEKVADFSYRSMYIQYGQQYWKIREYVRQALASGELDGSGAIARLRSTELGMQFPDSVAEMEANAFNYRQKMNGH